jgi:uncharacterized protein YbaR (Trm112 family)
MKELLMEVLACPTCGKELVLQDQTTEGDEIVTGTLECHRCAASFEIRDGVPCMLLNSHETNRTRQGFTEQWRLRHAGELEDKSSYGQSPLGRAAFMSEVGMLPAMGADDWILDAGCGPCDLTYAVAARNPQAQVVGLDFCDTIYMAARKARDHPNISFVHGDVMRPPFRKSSFAGLYSFGVLHHTQDTRVAFRSAASLVAEGGRMAIWIYPRLSESPLIVKSLYMLRDLFFLGKGHLIPGRLRFRLAQVVSLLYSPAFAVAFCLDGLSLTRRVGRKRLKHVASSFEIVGLGAIDLYRLMVFLVYDSITPEYQFRHSQPEVMQWFRENALVEAQAHDVIPGYYWGKCLGG